MTIETNITKMLGIKHPIIAAPMGPFYTTDLTIAVSDICAIIYLAISIIVTSNIEEYSISKF